MTHPKHILRTHDLTIGYKRPRKPDVVVAENLTLSLSGGQLVCLLGPNGAGKSTLMRTIAGMQPALDGQISLLGDDITALKSRDLATHLSIVLTDRPNVGLLNGYALVALGRHPYTDWTGRLSDYDEAMIRWAVDAVGATDIADRPVMELSDGQRQKFLIARALAQETELMLLDEPTAYLDLPRRAEIMHLLRHLAAKTGRAILLSTHDLDMALRSADTLWLMSGGAMRTGTPEDLVLSGAFEAAFQGEGVTFDRATGSFNVEQPTGESVLLSGHGIPHTWTRRALQRAGFTLLEDSNGQAPSIRIDIRGTENEPVWYLYREQYRTTHHSISDLLVHLRPVQEFDRIENA